MRTAYKAECAPHIYTFSLFTASVVVCDLRGPARGGRRPACCLRVRIRTAVGTGLLLSPSEWWARCVYEAFFRIRIRYLLEIASWVATRK